MADDIKCPFCGRLWYYERPTERGLRITAGGMRCCAEVRDVFDRLSDEPRRTDGNVIIMGCHERYLEQSNA